MSENRKCKVCGHNLCPNCDFVCHYCFLKEQGRFNKPSTPENAAVRRACMDCEHYVVLLKGPCTKCYFKPDKPFFKAINQPTTASAGHKCVEVEVCNFCGHGFDFHYEGKYACSYGGCDCTTFRKPIPKLTPDTIYPSTSTRIWKTKSPVGSEAAETMEGEEEVVGFSEVEAALADQELILNCTLATKHMHHGRDCIVGDLRVALADMRRLWKESFDEACKYSAALAEAQDEIAKRKEVMLGVMRERADLQAKLAALLEPNPATGKPGELKRLQDLVKKWSEEYSKLKETLAAATTAYEDMRDRSCKRIAELEAGLKATNEGYQKADAEIFRLQALLVAEHHRVEDLEEQAVDDGNHIAELEAELLKATNSKEWYKGQMQKAEKLLAHIREQHCQTACGHQYEPESKSCQVCLFGPETHPPETPDLKLRDACRKRLSLDGTDAEALEHALTQAENARDEMKHEVARLTAENIWLQHSEGGRSFSTGTAEPPRAPSVAQYELADYVAERINNKRALRNMVHPERSPPALKCSRCGQPVAPDTPNDTSIRAFVECPECIKKRWEQEEVQRKAS